MAASIQLCDPIPFLAQRKPFSPTGLGGRQGADSDFKYLDLCAQAMNEIKLEIDSICSKILSISMFKKRKRLADKLNENTIL